MANTFLLKIITPSHEVFNGEVQKVFLRNNDGSFEILANHESMITNVVPSIMKFTDKDGNENKLFISTAIVNINNNELVICSDAAEFESEIDEERAVKALERAERRLKEPEKYNKERAEMALIRAKERIALKRSNK